MPATSVDCSGCKAACCRAELVALTKQDRLEDYPAAIELGFEARLHLREMLPAATGWVLPHGSDGACVYLKGGRCSVYEKRPEMCRAFSCVGWVQKILQTTTRLERRRDKAFIDTAVWREGKKRLGQPA